MGVEVCMRRLTYVSAAFKEKRPYSSTASHNIHSVRSIWEPYWLVHSTGAKKALWPE